MTIPNIATFDHGTYDKSYTLHGARICSVQAGTQQMGDDSECAVLNVAHPQRLCWFHNFKLWMKNCVSPPPIWIEAGRKKGLREPSLNPPNPPTDTDMALDLQHADLAFCMVVVAGLATSLGAAAVFFHNCVARLVDVLEG